MRKCGNCNFCTKDGEDFVCTNEESVYVADFVDLKHSCDEWTGKENEE